MNNYLLERIKTYPNIRQCSIQTFNEQDKNEKSQSRILPMTDDNLEKCEKLQSMLPYWVYFSVNPMENWKRDKASVKKIQTWICDIDEWTKEEQLKLIENAPLTPSLVVESVHWFHLYYLADNDLTEQQYTNGNRWLKNYYNWDPKVCSDTARVLRLPWFYHQKWEKVMVEYRDDLSCGMLYSVEEITNAFPNQTETNPWVVKQREQLNKNLNENDDFWTKASELDNKAMLEEFSWTGWVSGDRITFKRNTAWTEQIYVNGKSTWCRIDRNWLIGSSDKWGPTWIQRLKRYWLVDRKELAQYLKSKHPEIVVEKKNTVMLNLKELMNVDSEIQLKQPDFSRWNEWIDNAIWKISKWELVILLWETWAWKTTFATFMARKNKESCYFVLEDSVDNIAKRYALKRAWITKEELNKWNRWEYKQQLFNEALDRFRKREIKFVDVWHKVDIATLIWAMKQLKSEWYSIFFIDNLWFVIWEWAWETEQTADISAKLVSFCLQENVCVVLLHHFKKWKATERDISQMRGSWKLWDDAFTVVKYIRDDNQTFLQVYKDRTWGELWTYEIEYERGDFKFVGIVV